MDFEFEDVLFPWSGHVAAFLRVVAEDDDQRGSSSINDGNHTMGTAGDPGSPPRGQQGERAERARVPRGDAERVLLKGTIVVDVEGVHRTRGPISAAVRIPVVRACVCEHEHLGIHVRKKSLVACKRRRLTRVANCDGSHPTGFSSSPLGPQCQAVWALARAPPRYVT